MFEYELVNKKGIDKLENTAQHGWKGKLPSVDESQTQCYQYSI